MLVLCGDFTDYGLPEEARVLARELTAAVKVPVVAVLGNHDYEAGKQNEIREILLDAGVTVLDGKQPRSKASGSPASRASLEALVADRSGPWGEQVIKRFVQEAVDEAMKLETALARLRTEQRVALLHYAPIRGTVEGEPPEIFPYLGSGRLEEPINRYRVTAVFMGTRIAERGGTDLDGYSGLQRGDAAAHASILIDCRIWSNLPCMETQAAYAAAHRCLKPPVVKTA